MSDEPQKPRPKVRARDIHDLRQAVIARHKFLASTKPLEEAKALIRDEYGADEDSCLAFIRWLKGEGPGYTPNKNTTIERVHVETSPETGDERYLETEPGSIPPRRPGTPPPPAKGRGR